MRRMDKELQQLVAKIKAARKRIADERKARTRAIVKMRAEGKTLQEIGDKFGITRQRVLQVINSAVRAN